MSSDRALLKVPEPRAAASATPPARKRHHGHRFPARWVFLSTLVSTLLGVTIIGSALAWTGSAYTEEVTVSAGRVDAAVTFTPNGNVIRGADGQMIAIGTGGVTNNSAFSIRYLTGDVSLTGISGAAGECSLDWFQASFVPFAQLFQQIQNDVPIPIAFRVDMAMLPGAPQGCDGAQVSFDLTFKFEAISPGP